SEAFVLETVGREWVAERVKSVRTISNCYSVGAKVEKTSPGMPTLVRDLGWQEGDPLNYGDLIADRPREGRASSRLARSNTLVTSLEGKLRVSDAFRILRDHGPAAHPEWDPRTSQEMTLCMHAAGDDRPSQTTNSMVSELLP